MLANDCYSIPEQSLATKLIKVFWRFAALGTKRGRNMTDVISDYNFKRLTVQASNKETETC